MTHSDRKLETKLEAFTAAKDYANTVTDCNITVEIDYIRPECKEIFDIALIIRAKENIRPKHKPGVYLFDIVDLPTELRHNEFIEFITNKCFEMEPYETESIVPYGIGESKVTIKEKYKRNPYIPLSSNPFMPKAFCIPLNDELVKVCLRKHNFDKKLINNYEGLCYYATLGCKALETLEQRIDNKIVTGRCDREVDTFGCTGPCVEDTASKILKEPHKFHIKQIKTAKVYCGKGIWKRVIVD